MQVAKEQRLMIDRLRSKNRVYAQLQVFEEVETRLVSTLDRQEKQVLLQPTTQDEDRFLALEWWTVGKL